MLVNFGSFSINLDNIILIRYGELNRCYGVSIEYKANNSVREFIFPCRDMETAKEYYNHIMEIYYENRRDIKGA